MIEWVEEATSHLPAHERKRHASIPEVQWGGAGKG